MSLKDIWKNKVDGEDDVRAEDINSVAEAVIDLEENADDAKVFVAYASITTFEEIREALQAEKAVFLFDQRHIGSLIGKEDGAWCFGSITSDGTLRLITCDTNNNWYILPDKYFATQDYADNKASGVLDDAKTYADDKVDNKIAEISDSISEEVETKRLVLKSFIEGDSSTISLRFNGSIVLLGSDQVATTDMLNNFASMSDVENYIDEQLGDIETALDGIIAIQNQLMGVSE